VIVRVVGGEQVPVAPLEQVVDGEAEHLRVRRVDRHQARVEVAHHLPGGRVGELGPEPLLALGHRQLGGTGRGHIRVDLQHVRLVGVQLPVEHVLGEHGDGAAGRGGVPQLPVPATGVEQTLADVGHRRAGRQIGREQLVGDLAERVVRPPAVQVGGALAPPADRPVQIAHDHRGRNQLEHPGQAAQLGVGVPARGHVLDLVDQVEQGAGVVLDHGGGDLDPDRVAVLVPVADLGPGRRDRAAADPGQVVDAGRDVVRVHQFGVRHRRELFAGVAGDPGHRRVRLQVAADGVGREADQGEPVRRVLERDPEPVLADRERGGDLTLHREGGTQPGGGGPARGGLLDLDETVPAVVDRGHGAARAPADLVEGAPDQLVTVPAGDPGEGGVGPYDQALRVGQDHPERVGVEHGTEQAVVNPHACRLVAHIYWFGRAAGR
jgi:hypothetical protein